MANMNDLLAMNAMFQQSFAPLNNYSENLFKLALAEKSRREALEAERGRMMLASQLQQQAQERAQGFQIERDKAERLFRLKDAEESRKWAKELEQERSKNYQKSHEESAKLQQKLRDDSRTKEETERLRRLAMSYGVKVEDGMPESALLAETQRAAGRSLKSTLEAMRGLEKEIAAESESGPEGMVKHLQSFAAGDPILTSYLTPEQKKDFESGKLDYNKLYLQLGNPSFFGGKTSKSKEAQQALVNAYTEAKNKLVEMEISKASRTDERRRPGYLEKLNLYRTLQKKADDDIAILRDPAIVAEAFGGLRPVPQPAESAPRSAASIAPMPPAPSREGANPTISPSQPTFVAPDGPQIEPYYNGVIPNRLRAVGENIGKLRENYERSATEANLPSIYLNYGLNRAYDSLMTGKEIPLEAFKQRYAQPNNPPPVTAPPVVVSPIRPMPNRAMMDDQSLRDYETERQRLIQQYWRSPIPNNLPWFLGGGGVEDYTGVFDPIK